MIKSKGSIIIDPDGEITLSNWNFNGEFIDDCLIESLQSSIETLMLEISRINQRRWKNA